MNTKYLFGLILVVFIDLLGFSLIIFWLPESLTPEKRYQMSAKRSVVTLQALFESLQRPLTGTLLATRFLYSLAFVILQRIFPLFVLRRFGMIGDGYLFWFRLIYTFTVVGDWLNLRLSRNVKAGHLLTKIIPPVQVVM